MKQRVPKFLCLGLIMRDILISGVPELPTHWEQTLVGKAASAPRFLFPGGLGRTASLPR